MGKKIAKSRLELLSGLTQGTCVPNFKRFGRKLREEVGFYGNVDDGPTNDVP